MQWSVDRNAGFSRAHPQRLYLPLVVDHEYHHGAVHVEAQEANPHSLLWFMRRLLALRRRHPAFGRGDLEFVDAANERVLAFVRRHEREQILVVANLSRFAQPLELDLRSYRDLTPVEIFGRTAFRPIGDAPYPLTLAPHAFYWFSLEPPPLNPTSDADDTADAPLPLVRVDGPWDDVLRGPARAELEEFLPGFLARQSWFLGADRQVMEATIRDALLVPSETTRSYLALVDVTYAHADPEHYVLPLAFAPRDDRGGAESSPPNPIARLRAADDGEPVEGVLYDALADIRFGADLLAASAPGVHGRFKGMSGLAVIQRNRRQQRNRPAATASARAVTVVQARSTVISDGHLILKLFRRVEPGPHPEWETGRTLTDCGYAHASPIIGNLDYRPASGSPMALAVLSEAAAGSTDGWHFTIDHLTRFFESDSVADPAPALPAPPTTATLLELAAQRRPPSLGDAIAGFCDWAEMLGERTAELHSALEMQTADPAFVPEPFSYFARRARYQSLRALAGRAFRNLRRRLPSLPRSTQTLAKDLLASEQAIFDHFRRLVAQPITASVIRVHGDFRLEQILVEGDEVMIIDFEGDPTRPLAERRLKRVPMRDVAGMIQSFANAVETVAQARSSKSEAWARVWLPWISAAYLRGYLRARDHRADGQTSAAQTALLIDIELLALALEDLEATAMCAAPEELAHRLRRILLLIELSSAGANTADS
jgi:maltose alpha-D-glucosyltransferase/alpha-amylase